MESKGASASKVYMCCDQTTPDLSHIDYAERVFVQIQDDQFADDNKFVLTYKAGFFFLNDNSNHLPNLFFSNFFSTQLSHPR